VKVRYDEGVAIRIGPEPCVAVRKNVDEASVGEGTGQPLSLEILTSRVPTLFRKRKATQPGALSQALGGPAGSKNLARVEAPWAGTGRSQVWPVARCHLVRIGKARSRSQ
jgi:hypothetical protein